MKKSKPKKFSKTFSNLSSKVTHIAGSSTAFFVALLTVIVWALLGPLFNFSDTWQLVINTGTTIITFLMVFVIQQTQNKDTIAMHLKLNELIASNREASNRLVDIEDLTEEELMVLKQFYIKLAKLSKKNKDVFSTHSIDEAEENHELKEKDQAKIKH